MTSDKDRLIALERRRCEAIGTCDLGALRRILSPDYVHIHMTGKIDDRDGHLAAIHARPRRTERGQIDARIFDSFAVLIGDQINIVPAPDGLERRIAAVCQQIAVRTGDDWQFISCQLTQKQAT